MSFGTFCAIAAEAMPKTITTRTTDETLLYIFVFTYIKRCGLYRIIDKILGLVTEDADPPAPSKSDVVIYDIIRAQCDRHREDDLRKTARNIHEKLVTIVDYHLNGNVPRRLNRHHCSFETNFGAAAGAVRTYGPVIGSGGFIRDPIRCADRAADDIHILRTLWDGFQVSTPIEDKLVSGRGDVAEAVVRRVELAG